MAFYLAVTTDAAAADTTADVVVVPCASLTKVE